MNAAGMPISELQNERGSFKKIFVRILVDGL